MSDSVVTYRPFHKLSYWEKISGKRWMVSFDLELAARCNFNCRHCYINLPANDREAKKNELSPYELKQVAAEAASMGALACLLTGGEPLLREDFIDIYLSLKRLGLLVVVFTNASLISAEHVRVFRKYPPRWIESTVYGVTAETFERITGKPGSFSRFQQGIKRLHAAGVPLSLKTIAMRSNFHEFLDIGEYCRRNGNGCFRYDPFLHLRFDGNSGKNETIRSERLTGDQIVALHRSDPAYMNALRQHCEKLIVQDFKSSAGRRLFHCGAGTDGFVVGYDGIFRLCSSLVHPDCLYDLKSGDLGDAWQNFIPRVLSLESANPEFLANCQGCSLINLCMWCPAHAHLETGSMDIPVEYFCRVAQARAEAVQPKVAPTD